MAVDGAGNVFVADSGNDLIVVLRGGGGGAGLWAAGQLLGQADGPGRRVGGRGWQRLHQDWGNYCMVILSVTGEVVLTFGWQGSCAGELKHPRGVAVDGAGNVVVTDSHNDRIVLFQGAAVPAASGLPERVRPLLAVRDGSAQQRENPACEVKDRGV